MIEKEQDLKKREIDLTGPPVHLGKVDKFSVTKKIRRLLLSCRQNNIWYKMLAAAVWKWGGKALQKKLPRDSHKIEKSFIIMMG